MWASVPGDHRWTQSRINMLLVAEARRGRSVIRLKGRDPFVFGRGGEECQALADARIRYCVVPDVSCAVAAPAYAGIPVTDRRHATAFSGFRSEHHTARSTTPLVVWDGTNLAVKLNPLTLWTRREVRAYLDRHELPRNARHEQGYPSLGCQPCTRAVRPGEHPRAGRWPGFRKTDCEGLEKFKRGDREGAHRQALEMIEPPASATA